MAVWERLPVTEKNSGKWAGGEEQQGHSSHVVRTCGNRPLKTPGPEPPAASVFQMFYWIIIYTEKTTHNLGAQWIFINGATLATGPQMEKKQGIISAQRAPRSWPPLERYGKGALLISSFGTIHRKVRFLKCQIWRHDASGNQPLPV
ncbi:uncharacterized protein AAEQ78_014842 [Lycaon pictus]